MKRLNLLKIPASETVTVHNLALLKINAGEKIWNLGAGEPMIDTPGVIVKAAEQAMREHKTHYPPVAGIPPLRETVSRWMNEFYGSRFRAENVIAVNGGKLGIYLLMQALLKPGDGVLIPSPYWVSYPNIVKIFNGKPSIIPVDRKEWKLKSSDVLKYSTSRTKVLMMNNGSNPTGSIYGEKELKNILTAARKKNLFVISDEVYSGLVYGGAEYVSCARFEELRDRVAVIQSCSKNFAMTGFRIGFVAAEKEVIKALGGLLSQSTSGVSTVSQWAALAAIENAKTIMPFINEEMRNRRDIFLEEFKNSFGYELEPPTSALYTFVPLRYLGWKGDNSAGFCRAAMRKANVAVVPGSAFGIEGYVRFSFGERPEILKGGIRALAEAFKK